MNESLKKDILNTNMNESLKKDILNTIGSIYKMNAPHAIGYLFNPTHRGDEIVNGMYCDRVNEINESSWTYFVSFSDKVMNTKVGHIYKIGKEKLVYVGALPMRVR